VISLFLLKPFLALLFITISCSLLGVFVLWKKLAYFGDGLSHSILLGFVLGALLDCSQIASLAFFSLFFAFLVSLASRNSHFSKDTVIAISSYFCIALAIILNDIFAQNLNFNSYVFGDILTVGNQEIYALAIISILTIIYTFFAFRKILLININSDLARIEGIRTQFWNLSFLILLSLTISFSVKIVGVFLMTALLVLPAAIARIWSFSAKQMMFLSAFISLISAVISFKVADSYNLTISSSIIATFCIIFLSSLFIKKLSN
jgi:zinc transport system permease protein